MQKSYGPVLETRQPLVYLLDDDEDDALLLQEAFLAGIPSCQVRIFTHGLVMLEVLASDTTYPDLICVDLQMPYPDGLEVVSNLKVNKQCAHIPVIINSGSCDPDKIRTAYQIGAQTVFNKPGNYNDLLEMVAAIGQYWFKFACLPVGMN
ncbi:response regulator [Dyadobacter linearis]|uniref:response regulator n=1 Tax=Dyadobacter linearis TaxID=2823330 RepID=UPI001BFC7D9B|nr:response regulator [Dyadobacter sp. CECT 9623]